MFIHAQWRQNLTGQSSLIKNLSAVNDSAVWAVDQEGKSVSLSNDGGASWLVNTSTSDMLAGNGSVTGISAVSATTAYAVVCNNANAGIYKTTNSGFSWTRQSTMFNSLYSWPDFVYFWNENEGVAVGDPVDNTFEIYVTRDGGGQWNRVSASSIPLSNTNEYSYSTNTVFRVLGDTICFYTSKGRLFRSFDKGLTWNSMNTPVTNGNYMSFAFKDDNNGLCCYTSVMDDNYQLYSTSDGGASWNTISGAGSVDEIYYSPVHKAYFSANYHHGLMYSLDDGLTWTSHPSLKEMGISAMCFLPSGKIYAGGWSYVYRTTDYQKANIYVADVQIKNNNTIDVSYSEEPDPVTSQQTGNYIVGYIQNGLNAIKVNTATQDETDKKIIHLKLDGDIPLDTIKVNVYYVKDNKGESGFSIINESPTSERYIYNLASAIGNVASDFDVYWNQLSRSLVFKGNTGLIKAEVFDLNGRVLFSENINSDKINLSGLNPGIYILKWRNSNGIIVRKFAVN